MFKGCEGTLILKQLEKKVTISLNTVLSEIFSEYIFIKFNDLS